MKEKEFERLAKTYLLPGLPGFAGRGRQLFMAPIAGLLRGIVWEPSTFERYVGAVEAFAQPLYVPVYHLVLSYGVGFGGRRELDPSDPHPEIDRLLTEMQTTGVSFLAEFGDEAAFANWMERRFGTDVRSGVDPNFALRWGASKLLIGETESALEALDAAVAEAAKSTSDPEWVYRVAGQCGQLAALAREDRALAIAQLAEWRRGTLAALKLTKWAVPDWP